MPTKTTSPDRAVSLRLRACAVIAVASAALVLLGPRDLAATATMVAVGSSSLGLYWAGWVDGRRRLHGTPPRSPEDAGRAPLSNSGPPQHARDAVAVLNEALQADPAALGRLLDVRVPCTEALGRHPSIQVARAADGTCTVGVLGLINGCLGVIDGGPLNGWGWVTCVLEDGRPVRFEATVTPPSHLRTVRRGR